MEKIVIYLFAVLSAGFLMNQSIDSRAEDTTSKDIEIITEELSEAGQNDIEVNYPEFHGLSNGQDTVVNLLIRDDICGLVRQNKNSMYEAYNLLLYLDYEVKHLNHEFISIYYSGTWGALNSGRGYHDYFHAINIDIKHAKIVTKNDIFNNKTEIFKMLMQDKFDSITTTDGIKGAYPFSFFVNEIGWVDPDQGLDPPAFEYYIDGDNLVIAYAEGDSHEYSIAIDKVSKYLNEDILKLIRGENGKLDENPS